MRLTVLLVGAGHSSRPLNDQPEEIYMNKHNDRVSIRKTLEKTFASFVAAAILTFIASGTYVMCIPTAGLA
jgi:hypothetical protein